MIYVDDVVAICAWTLYRDPFSLNCFQNVITIIIIMVLALEWWPLLLYLLGSGCVLEI